MTKGVRAAWATAKIFISNSRNDMAFVDRLEPTLVAHGLAALIDRQQVYASEDWWQRLLSLITQTDTVWCLRLVLAGHLPQVGGHSR